MKKKKKKRMIFLFDLNLVVVVDGQNLVERVKDSTRSTAFEPQNSSAGASVATFLAILGEFLVRVDGVWRV